MIKLNIELADGSKGLLIGVPKHATPFRVWTENGLTRLSWDEGKVKAFAPLLGKMATIPEIKWCNIADKETNYEPLGTLSTRDNTVGFKVERKWLHREDVKYSHIFGVAYENYLDDETYFRSRNDSFLSLAKLAEKAEEKLIPEKYIFLLETN